MPNAVVEATQGEAVEEHETPKQFNTSFGFKFIAAGSNDANARPDRGRVALDEMKQTATEDEFLRAIWPQDLCKDMQNNEAIYTHIQSVLEKYHGETGDHREISQDGSVSTSMLLPKPLEIAARQICLRHGLHAETFMLALASNITWLEHHWTRLGTDPEAEGVNVLQQYVGDKAWSHRAEPKATAAPGSAQAPEKKRSKRAAKPICRKPVQGVVQHRQSAPGVQQEQSDVQGSVSTPASGAALPSEGKRRRKTTTPIGGNARPVVANQTQLTPLPGVEQQQSDGHADQPLVAIKMDGQIFDALATMLPKVDLGNTSLRQLRARLAADMGQPSTAIEEYKDQIKAIVLEWIAEHSEDAANVPAAFENTREADVIQASQRPCSSVIAYCEPAAAVPLDVEAVHYVHSIMLAILVLQHGSSSTKRSFTCELSTDFVTKSKNAPPCSSDGDVYMVESSKGVRTCILNYDRVSCTSDEVVNTFSTPWSENRQSGALCHHLPRNKMNTWTQGERDDVITASGTIHLKAYAFQFKVFGQNEARYKL